MRKLSSGMTTVSQAVAIGIVFAFLAGMRWQDGFYEELGYPWISSYSNYLDTMRAGIPIVKVYLFAACGGWFSIWLLSNWKYEWATATLVICGPILLPMGDLVASWFEAIEQPEYLIFKSNYQIITAGFFIGGTLKILTSRNLQTAIKQINIDNKFVLYALMLISIAIVGLYDSPKILGSAIAKQAILTGFRGFSVVTDNTSAAWNLIGHSQGNLILVRPLYEKNTFQMKVSNTTSELIIYPTSPIRLGGALYLEH